MASAGSNFNRRAIEFPDDLPEGVYVDVPQPLENHPEWTSTPFSYADIPPIFDDLIDLPDYQTQPALYAAAVDTIRMTNTYFQLTGSYSSEHSRKHALTRALCEQKQQDLADLTELADEDSTTEDWVAVAASIPNPPDPRTLFVKDDMGDPTDENLDSLWTRAFKEVRAMSELTWKIYLGYTRQQLIDQADARNRHDEAWLILEIFKRYLVWHELCEEETNRAIRFEQKQPSWTELEDFFSREDVREEGVTLVDICHAFPRARDAEMLVYRIEHFATLEKLPPHPMDGGVEDPIESRYMPRLPPSRQRIEEAASNLLRLKGSSISLEELADLYLPSRVHHGLMQDILEDLGARLDTVTGRFFLPSNQPRSRDLRGMVDQDSAAYINGVTLQEATRLFQLQAQDRGDLLRTVSDLFVFDEAEELYFPLYEDEKKGEKLSPEGSLIARDNARIRIALEHGDLVWDKRFSTYVPRAQSSHSHLGQIDRANGHLLGTGSPTDTVADTVAGGTPPPQRANSIGKITAWGIEPTDPRTRPFAPVAPAAEVSDETLRDPSVEQQSAGRSLSVAAPDKPRQGKKRGATEKAVESSRGKKARKAPKIRCSRKTMKNVRCKKQKDREDGEDEWDCGAHKQS